MHEWALAESVVETVLREAGGMRVIRVDLRFGELQQVDRGIFAAALADLAPGSGIDPSIFAIEVEEARFACRHCGRSWTLAGEGALTEEEREAVHLMPEAAHAYLRCPGCGSVDFEIAAGRGVLISSIEVEDREPVR